MARYLVKRMLQMLGVLWLFVTLTFGIFYLTPGDPMQKWVGDAHFSPEMVEEMRVSFGLHAPWYVQYLRYLKNLVTGEMGISFSYYPRPVAKLIGEAFGRTLLLFVTGQVLAGLLGIWLGKWIGWRRGSWIDQLGTVVGVTSSTFFYPLAVLLNIWIFGYLLGWFPLGGLITPEVWIHAPAQVTVEGILGDLLLAGCGLLLVWGVARRIFWKIGVGYLALLVWISRSTGYGVYLWDLLSHLILPVLTLVLLSFGGMMLLMRDSMVETSGSDYVRFARAQGLPDHIIRDRHAARTALLPVLTHFSLQIGLALTGGMVVEVLFSWPGLGSLLLKATVEQDLPLALGAWTLIGIFVLLAHLVADLLLVALDPRLGVEG